MYKAAKHSVPNLQWIQATNTMNTVCIDKQEDNTPVNHGPLDENWNLHLSLSRPCYLKLYQLDLFTRQLKEKLQDIKK
jgi:hypothetical protein